MNARQNPSARLAIGLSEKKRNAGSVIATQIASITNASIKNANSRGQNRAMKLSVSTNPGGGIRGAAFCKSEDGGYCKSMPSLPDYQPLRILLTLFRTSKQIFRFTNVAA